MAAPAMTTDDLPGELILWILIASELAVFMAGISVMVILGLMDPEGFATAQGQLDGRMAALNTVVLVSSGLFAARAERAAAQGRVQAARKGLLLAALGGVIFLTVKGVEYARDIQAGIGIDSHPFFTFYYLLSGFHAAHVAAGIVLFGLVSRFNTPQNIATASAFWHMVDLVWVILFPVIYLVH